MAGANPQGRHIVDWVTHLERYSESVASQARQEREASHARLIEELDSRYEDVQSQLKGLQEQHVNEVLKIRTDVGWLHVCDVATLRSNQWYLRARKYD